jgi:tRNA nucleotidyltransferase (CCA-adding enzyme)
MPDYMYMLESRLSAEQRAAMMRVQELAGEAGVNVYLTGGAVRDLISGMPIRDLDFTVEGNPSRLAAELEKGGARIIQENDKLRQVELIFSGDVDGSLTAARDEIYARPGTRPEIRWSTIMEDLRRRDFSINAIAISLNPASRGLLLDPTNGLADLENREIRALSIHSFTNQPIRLMRAIRFSARMDFKLESRTEEWFALALERGLQETLEPADVGGELKQLGADQKPVAILKAWEARGLIGAIHPQLARRHPHYDMLGRVMRAREELFSVGLRPRLFAPVMVGALGKLKSRERSLTLHRLGFRSSEVDSVLQLESEVQKVAKMLAGRKTAQPAAAFAFLEKTRTDLIVFALADTSNAKVGNKIRNYLRRWRPLRLALPGASLELESLGMPRGAKFDKVMEAFFQAQLVGKGRTPEDRTKLLRRLAGIKEPPKVVKEEKKRSPSDNKMKKKLVGRTAPETLPAVSAAKAPAAPAAVPAETKASSAARVKPPLKKSAPSGRKARPSASRRAGRARRR